MPDRNPSLLEEQNQFWVCPPAEHKSVPPRNTSRRLGFCWECIPEDYECWFSINCVIFQNILVQNPKLLLVFRGGTDLVPRGDRFWNLLCYWNRKMAALQWVCGTTLVFFLNIPRKWTSFSPQWSDPYFLQRIYPHNCWRNTWKQGNSMNLSVRPTVLAISGGCRGWGSPLRAES